MSPIGDLCGRKLGTVSLQECAALPPPPPGTNTLGFPAGIPERRPSPSPVHLRGPVASTLGAPEQRCLPPHRRHAVPGPGSPPVHRSPREGLSLRRLDHSAGLPGISTLPRARCPPPRRGPWEGMPPGGFEAASWATGGAGGRPQGA